MSVATVTASLAAKISLCAVIVYNHRLGRRKWRYNRSIKPAPGLHTACWSHCDWMAWLHVLVVVYCVQGLLCPVRQWGCNLRQLHVLVVVYCVQGVPIACRWGCNLRQLHVLVVVYCVQGLPIACRWGCNLRQLHVLVALCAENPVTTALWSSWKRMWRHGAIRSAALTILSKSSLAYLSYDSVVAGEFFLQRKENKQKIWEKDWK